MATQHATRWGQTRRSPSPLRVQVGSKIPAIELDHGFAGSDGVKVNLADNVRELGDLTDADANDGNNTAMIQRHSITTAIPSIQRLHCADALPSILARAQH